MRNRSTPFIFLRTGNYPDFLMVEQKSMVFEIYVQSELFQKK